MLLCFIWMSGVILHSILCLTVNSHHSYVLFVYCFTLVLCSLSSFYFFVYCVLCLAAGIGEKINFLFGNVIAKIRLRLFVTQCFNKSELKCAPFSPTMKCVLHVRHNMVFSYWYGQSRTIALLALNGFNNDKVSIGPSRSHSGHNSEKSRSCSDLVDTRASLKTSTCCLLSGMSIASTCLLTNSESCSFLA